MAMLYKNGTIDHIEFLIENFDLETVLDFVRQLPYFKRKKVIKMYGLSF